MSSQALQQSKEPQIRIGKVHSLSIDDTENLCGATELAIADGIGFNWITPPMREVLESYWRGVLVVPERILIGAWLDGVLCGSIQLVKPSRSKETSYFCARIENHFIAPWARGHGMATRLLEHAEYEAATQGFSVIRLDVRATQTRAIHLYKELDYVEWGVLPHYEFVNGEMIAGHFFYKMLQPASSIE